jgi:thiol-disulfide isomerase/thioredoxin
MPRLTFLSAAMCSLLALLPAGRGAGVSPAPVPAAKAPSPALLQALARPDVAGRPFPPGSVRGHVVVVNFWATWCAPCLAEMPALSALQAEQRTKGLQVVGVAMDDDVAPVRAAVRRLGLGYPVLMGDAVLARAFGGVLGLPVTVVLDRNGAVRRRIDGPLQMAALRQEIAGLLR